MNNRYCTIITHIFTVIISTIKENKRKKEECAVFHRKRRRRNCVPEANVRFIN